MSLQRALLLLLAAVLVITVVPAGMVLDRRLGEALLDRARSDLATAPMVLKDRETAIRDVRMMHARDVADAPGLAEALVDRDLERARRIVREAARPFPEQPILLMAQDVDAEPFRVVGEPSPGVPTDLPRPLVEATRQGEMPVSIVSSGEALHRVALAPVRRGERWLGSAGGATRVDETEAGTLAGLTRSDVAIFRNDGWLVSAAGDTAEVRGLVAALSTLPDADTVRTVVVDGSASLVATAPYGPTATVAFSRPLERELAVLPTLRRTAATITLLALGLALLVGGAFAHRVARPVRALAEAADGFASGSADAPLPSSSIHEVRRVADAFGAMRQALASRLDELESMNRALEERQERLAELQAELLSRERTAATGRLLQQLAHEIRNPVASVRNCLEVVRRKGRLAGEAQEFADMAVDELLRMHELAERMLDVHRPGDLADATCDVVATARDVALLVRAGGEENRAGVVVLGESGIRAAIPADQLKQVLFNLVRNALEVTPEGATVEVVVEARDEGPTIEVLDRGPGIPADALPRLFDPFFTTKREVHGVGLGLYTAETLVRSHGGRISAGNRSDGPGARFLIELAAPTEAEA